MLSASSIFCLPLRASNLHPTRREVTWTKQGRQLQALAQAGRLSGHPLVQIPPPQVDPQAGLRASLHHGECHFHRQRLRGG